LELDIKILQIEQKEENHEEEDDDDIKNSTAGDTGVNDERGTDESPIHEDGEEEDQNSDKLNYLIKNSEEMKSAGSRIQKEREKVNLKILSS